MHGTRLYEQRDLSLLTPEQADRVQAFFADQGNLERELLDSLRADPLTADSATDERVGRASQLIWIWDWLSLALCLDWAPDSAHAVPTADEPVELALRVGEELSGGGGSPGTVPPAPDAARALTLTPWPFRQPTVTVRCEGQRLTDRCADAEELREALAQAPWETIRFELRSG
jgi:hypothetical protein